MPPRLPTRLVRSRRWGVRASLWLHIGLVSLVATEWLLDFPLLVAIESAVAPAKEQIEIRAVQVEPPSVADVVLSHVPEWEPEPESTEPPAPEAAELLAGLVDPHWQELVDPIEQPAAARVHAGFVSREIQRVVAQSNARTVDENQDKLTALGNKLAGISSDKAVGDINEQLAKVLGTAPRADRPAEEPVAGEFDFDTAQFHDVKRDKNDREEFIYTAVLVDAKGRRFETPMSGAEGAQLYKTMQIVKSNPLLERVYRGVVMSLLDQVIKASKP